MTTSFAPANAYARASYFAVDWLRQFASLVWLMPPLIGFANSLRLAPTFERLMPPLIGFANSLRLAPTFERLMPLVPMSSYNNHYANSQKLAALAARAKRIGEANQQRH